jgi:hypothetical protein
MRQAEPANMAGSLFLSLPPRLSRDAWWRLGALGLWLLMRLDPSALSRVRLRLAGRLTRTRLYLLAAVVLVAVGLSLGFGPLVRARIAAAAEKRRLDVSVGAVRPGWFAIRLHDVAVRPRGVPGLSVHLNDVRIGVTLGLALDAVELHGGQISVSGKAEQLRDDLERWAHEDSPRPEGPRKSTRTRLSADGLALRWADDGSLEPRLELNDLRLSREPSSARVAVADGRMRFGRAVLSLGGASAELDANMMLERSHVGTLLVELLPAAPPSPTQPPSGSEVGAGGPNGGSPAVPTVANRAMPGLPGRARASAPVAAAAPVADPAAPFVALPDPRTLRRQLAALATQLSARTVEGAQVAVDSLTWSLHQSTGDRVALTFGPGPVSLERTASAIELRYSTEVAGKPRPGATSSSLSVRALVPSDGTDVAITLEGGPVSLSALGIQEGAAGLVDVARAQITGRARIVLAGDGGALSFDAQLGTHALSMNNARLSGDVVRDLDLDVRARGVATGGEIRLDDFAAAMGSLRVTGSGVLDQEPDFVTAAFRFEIPDTMCKSLLSSVPSGLLAALQGTDLGGTFGARGHFAFDSRAPDDLDLQYDIRDRCRMVQVPDDFAPDRFKQQFLHRIYLPDGSTADELTGPGTTNWTSIEDISPYMRVAVLTTEDGAFARHHGFNHFAIRASIVANLKARRFVRGASTITMQLAKNLFLTRDKTLARKLEELILTDYLEQTFTKEEILELYLNVIEFGPAVYGVTSAAEYYFGRTPAELNLAECLFLSSLLPAPLRYSAMREGEQPTEGWMRNIRTLMQVAHRNGLINDAELTEAQDQPVAFWHGDERPPPRAPVHAHVRLDGDDVEAMPPLDALPDTP